MTVDPEAANNRVIAEYFKDRTEAAFAELFYAYAPSVVRYFRARGCDAALAEDLTQDVMLKVHRHAADLRDSSLFRAWLFKIARNILYQHWKGGDNNLERVDLEMLDSRISLSPNAFSPASPGFEVAEWLSCLVPQERQVMLLRYLDQLEMHEIAAVLEVPIGTVQWRIFRSKKKLASLFRKRLI